MIFRIKICWEVFKEGVWGSVWIEPGQIKLCNLQGSNSSVCFITFLPSCSLFSFCFLFLWYLTRFMFLYLWMFRLKRMNVTLQWSISALCFVHYRIKQFLIYNKQRVKLFLDLYQRCNSESQHQMTPSTKMMRRSHSPHLSQ